MTAGLDQFQVAAPDQYAGATPNWKRRMLAAQLLQQQAQTGDKVYGAGLGSMKLLASALGGWMEGKEEAKDRDSAMAVMKNAPYTKDIEPEPVSPTPAVSTVPTAPRPAVSTGGGTAVANYDPKNPPDFLDLVGGAEGTDKGRGYNETLGYGKFAGGPQDLENMPVSQVRQLQARMLQHPENTFNSSAAGRGQIVGKTLQGLIDQGVVKPDELYNKDVQDRAIDHLARARGADAAGLRNEWEGLRRVPDDVIVAAYNKRYGAKQPTQTAGELPTDVSSADPNFVPSMQGNKVKPDIAAAMAPMMPPKAAPVPSPSMAPPDLKADPIRGQYDRQIANAEASGDAKQAASLREMRDLSLQQRSSVQTAPQPAAAPQPPPQQMAQARPQPQAREPAPPGNVVTTDKPPLSARDNAFVRNVIQRQSEGRNVSAIDVQLAQDMINPKWTKYDDTWLTDGRGNFRRAPRSEIVIDGTRYGTDLKPIVGKMANEGHFKGDSLQIQALNGLIKSGQITKNEAENVAAGHAITVGDQVIFQTPVGIAQLSRQQFAASQGQAAAAPAGQGQAPAAAAAQRTAGAPAPRTPTQAAPPPSVPGMIPIGSKPPKEVKPPAEHQSNANTHANRMEHAEATLQALENAGLSQKDTLLGKLPLELGRYGQSDQYKSFDRAQNAFITGKLRKESGAAISDPEYSRYHREFIPSPNDTPDVLLEKRKARAIAIQTMKDEAGAAYKPMTPDELYSYDKVTAEKAKKDISSLKAKYGL